MSLAGPVANAIRPVARAALLGMLLTVALAVGSSTVARATDPPTMSISPGVASPGQTITVSVAAWPAGSADVALCGPPPPDADRSCDAAGRQSIAIAADGTGTVTLVVDTWVGCPCVVQIRARTGGLVQALPLELIGAGPATVSTAAAAGSDQSSGATETNEPVTQNTTIWALAGVATLALLLGLRALVSRRRRARRRGRRSAGADADEGQMAGT